MSRRLAPFLGALFLLSSLAVTAVQAEETPAPAASPFASVLELLRSKRIISDEEAKTLALRGGSAAEAGSLIELLAAKGLISAQEASKIAASTASSAPEALGEKVFPASQDARFIAQLRVRWVKNKNRGKDFDEWFAGMNDPGEIIGRMRVLGALSPAEADELERRYRDGYLTGAISAALENKENDYLERIRKSVAVDLDEKVNGKFQDQWTQRIRLGGDFRLRYEGDFFNAGNGLQENFTTLTQVNSTSNQQLMRLRARLNAEVKLSDSFQAGIGIATGNGTNAISSNVTLGTFFTKPALQLDRAFLKWSPDPSITLVGGRFANPWLSTDLVWYPDLSFDGVELHLAPRLSDACGLFFTTGLFPVQDVQDVFLAQHNKWLFGSQLGAEFGSADRLSGKVAAAYYDFINTVGVVNDNYTVQPSATDWSAPSFAQKGNTYMFISPTKAAYASAFRELELTGTLDLGYWHPVHAVLFADYVNNIGFNRADVSARTGSSVKKETEGFQVGLTVGYPKLWELGDWQGVLSYKYLEADAVMDAFTDQDFHLGGTNAKGWIAGFDLGLGKDVWLSTRWYSADEISGAPFSVDVLHVDINAKF